MAGEAVGVLELLGGVCVGCRGNKKKTKRAEQQISNKSHAFEETLMQEKLP